MITGHENISLESAHSLGGLFRARVVQSPDLVAYRHYDPATEQWQQTTWAEMADMVGRWQEAMQAQGLEQGDRVGIMTPNCREWVMFDQAALGLGLVSVPLFFNDRGGNVAYIANSSEMKILVIAGEEQWASVAPFRQELQSVERIITLEPVAEMAEEPRLVSLQEWLPVTDHPYQLLEDIDANAMCTLVYTSGTTGQPKGVMLSHHNILSNTHEALQTTRINPDDLMLSFLPLSHMLERTGGYYLPMMAGISVAYARSILQLAEDLQIIRPTLLISVPRIYERVYAKIQEGLKQKPAVARALFNLTVNIGWKRFLHLQGRGGWSVGLLLWPLLNKLVASKLAERLGGRLRLAISGGAPLPPDIAKTFLAMGINVLQGYGLTETSPVLAVSHVDDNIPESVGLALPGTQLKVAEDGELLAKGSAIMLGFWRNPEETARVIDQQGWFHTGDIAKIDTQGHVYITGRIKDIIVLANGEKVSPADMEIAIAMDPLFEQVMVIGEGRPFLSALISPEVEAWQQFASELGLDPADPNSFCDPRVEQLALERISEQLGQFPGYAQVRKVVLQHESWSVENGLLTPTLKTKRGKIMKQCQTQVSGLYANH